MAVVASATEAQVGERRGALGRLLVWGHLLSLDAPAVAGLWTWFVGRCFGAREPKLWPVAMFLAVWILYAGDRLLDARGAGALEERHRFHWEHRRGFCAGMLVCGVALAGMLPWLALPAGVYGLAGLLAAWLAAIHLSAGRPLPKEWAVGVFFAAAVFLPVLHWRTVPAMVGFALLCTLNCLYIHAWEHPYSSARDTHGWTIWGLRRMDWLVGVIVLGACVGGPVMVAEAMGAGLLWGLDRGRTGLGRTGLRTAADVVLLTPLLVLPWVL